MSNARVNRLRLLAASSLMSAGLAAGCAAIVGLIPGTALAAGECGPPLAGAVTCAPGAFPAGIAYPTATPLTVTLQQTPTTAVTVANGGVTISDLVAGDSLALNRAFTGVAVAGSAAPSVTNTTGSAVGVIGNGAVTVDLSAPTTDSGIIISGSSGGIVLSSTSTTGAVALTLTNGAVTATSGSAIQVNANGGASTVNTGATSINGATGGIVANQLGNSGSLSVTSTGAITATGGDGVTAAITNLTNASTLTVNTGGLISASGDGVTATQSGVGSMSVNNAGGIGTGAAHIGGTGILAQITNLSSTGSVTVNNSGNIYANGVYGIAVVNLGGGSASINTGTGTALTPLIIDPTGYAAYAYSAGGPAVVAVGNFNTYIVGAAGSAGSGGVFAESGAAADVALAPSVIAATGSNDVFTVSGNDSSGISAINNNGGLGTGSIVVTTGANEAISVSGSRNTGILAQSLGLGNVSVTTGSGTIVVDEAGVVGNGLSPRQAGIDAESAGGNVLVINASTITVTGSLTDPSTGIFSANAGPGTIGITNNRAITSNTGDGVAAQSDGGAITITTNANLTTPGLATSTSSGISAAAGLAPINVTVGAGSAVTGGFGVLATGGAAVSVDNSGTIIGTNTTIGDALDIIASGASTVTNHVAGTLTAVGAGPSSATVWVNGVGPMAIVNAGLITTSQTGHNGYAINYVGTGAGTITNVSTGLINGRVIVGNGGVTFNNAGVWSTNGTNPFGLGLNTLNNTGALYAGLSGTGAVPAALLSTTNFTGLAALNNSGLVSMVNGLAGDSLTTTGAYVGSGAGVLAIDVLAAPVPVVDQFTAGGTITGSTAVTLVPIGNPGLVNAAIVAHGNAVGSSASALTVAPGSRNEGFIHYGIVYNAGAGNYLLFGTPNGAAYETAMLGEAQNNLWYKTADAWSDHMSELRDAHGAGDQTVSGLHSWGVFNGGQLDRSANRSFTAFGVTSNYNIGFNQNYVGAELGLDGSSTMYGGAMVYGLTGGYIDSHAYFGGTGDEFDAHAYNLGAYVGFEAGGLFVNGLAKYDSGKTDMRGNFAGYRVGQNYNQWGGTIEAGYRFGMGGAWFLEPVGSISYVKGDSHDFTTNGAAFHFATDDSARGKLGLRTGASMDLAWGSKIAPYAHVEAVDEFKGNQTVTFTNAGQTIVFGNTAPKTYGEAGVGVDLIARNGFTAFFEGHGDFGNDIRGYGSRIGVRWKW